MRRLADRGETLTVAAVPWVAPVYRAMTQVAEVIELPFAHKRLDLKVRWRLAREMHGRFDAAYVLPNSIKSALLPWFAGIARRVGYQGEGRPWMLNRRLPNPPGRPPMVAFYSALAEVGSGEKHSTSITNPMSSSDSSVAGAAPQSISTPHPLLNGGELGDAPRLTLPGDAIDAATRAAGVSPGRYWAFAPGAEYGPAKRWPPEHYAELARSLQPRSGLPILLIGSGKEAPLCEEIAALAPGTCQVLAGKTSLIDAFALIAGAKGVVSNDSGLMHVAAAFGVPQVAVYGSTSPEHTPPLNTRAQVLWLKDELQLDCAPCFDRECRFGHTRCLTGVSAQRVEAALDRALVTSA